VRNRAGTRTGLGIAAPGRPFIVVGDGSVAATVASNRDTTEACWQFITVGHDSAAAA